MVGRSEHFSQQRARFCLQRRSIRYSARNQLNILRPTAKDIHTFIPSTILNKTIKSAPHFRPH